MRCRAIAPLAFMVALLTALPLPAQDGGPAPPVGDWSQWKWFQGVTIPAGGAGRYAAFHVAPDVFGRSASRSAGREELADLRLADATGRPVPFALRVLRTDQRRQDMPIARQFDAGPNPKQGYFQVSLELKDVGAPGYNEIEVDTEGVNFRRKVEALGDTSDRFDNPRPLLLTPKGKHRYLVRYETEKGLLDVRRFDFDFKRFPFVQVRVAPDASTGEQIPRIRSVTLRRSIDVPGEYVTHPAILNRHESVPTDRGPGSAWYVELGSPVPCEKLSFRVNGPAVERPWRLQIAEPDQPRRDIHGTDWRWRREGAALFLDVRFSEERANRYRLVVTDFANAPLNIVDVTYTSCVRQVVFERAAAAPLRLYVGNPEAGPAHYDIERALPRVLTPPPAAAALGPPQENPVYVAPPPTIAEAHPWLIDAVLVAACLGLLAVLALLARQALRRADAAPPTPEAPPPA